MISMEAILFLMKRITVNCDFIDILQLRNTQRIVHSKVKQQPMYHHTGPPAYSICRSQALSIYDTGPSAYSIVDVWMFANL